MSPTGARISRARGFSLIELTVVMAVVGLIGAAVLPRLSLWDEDSRLRLAGRRLVSVVRLARSEAVTGGTGTVLRLGAEGKFYILEDGKVINTESLPRGVELKGYSIKGVERAEAPEITFRPDGRASEAALYLGAGDKMMTFHLQPLTGRLEAMEGRVVFD